MAKIEKYIPVADRVTTLTVAGDLRVVNVMVGICRGKPCTECAAAVEGRAVRPEDPDDEIERRATNIRRAMERLAEDVRELCAKYVEALEPAESHAKPDVAAAIRELEL